MRWRGGECGFDMFSATGEKEESEEKRETWKDQLIVKVTDKLVGRVWPQNRSRKGGEVKYRIRGGLFLQPLSL